MIDLLRELHSFPSAFDPAYEQLPDLALSLPGLGATPIETDDRFWQPVASGPLAVIVPVYYGLPPSFMAATEDKIKQPHDLLAFYPNQPDHFWLRTGQADVVRGDLIESGMTWGRPVFVVSNALTLLRCRMGAVLLLDDDAAWKLIGVETVIADTLETAERIERMLRRPPEALPAIRIVKRTAS